MCNKQKRLNVLAKIQKHVETASQCGITQTGKAKTELEMAFRGSVAIIGDLVETVATLEQQLALLNSELGVSHGE